MHFVKPFALLLAAATVAGCHHQAAPRLSLNRLIATPKSIDSMWNLAVDLYTRHKWEEAATMFDRVKLELPPGDRRVLTGRLYLGELYVRGGSYLQGVREYRRLVDEFPADSLAPEALLRAAGAYRALWRAPDLDATYGITAQSVYSELLTRYPVSPAAAKAKEEMQGLDNWFAQKSYKAASFYIKYKAYEAAIIYLKALAVDYPRATIVPTALADLISVYRILGYTEDIKDKCAFMRVDWAATPQFAKACPQPPVVPAEKSAGS